MALSNLTKVQTVGIGSNIEVVGVVTTGQFKSGTSNLHSSGVELTNLNVSGIATIGGNLSIGGTLTYEDVTNIDSIGIITARAGVNVSGGQLDVGSNIKLGNAGVITATSFSGSGANLTGIDATKIITGNTQVQTIDTGSDGHVKVTTEGAERLRINSSGNLGLGESSSIDARLHVNSGTDNTTLFLESTDGDVNLGMADNAGSCRLLQAGGNLRFRTGGNANAFGTGDSEKMVLDSSGRLLIGTTTEGLATYGENLTIGSVGHAGMTIRTGTGHKGTIYFSDATSGNAEFKGSLQYDHSDDSMRFRVNETDKMTIGSDGNVHINTTDNGNASAQLNIEDSSSAGADVLKIMNKPAGANGKAKLVFHTETSAGQGCQPYIQSLSGADAGPNASNSHNAGGLEFHTRSGGSGTDNNALRLRDDGTFEKYGTSGNILLLSTGSDIEFTRGGRNRLSATHANGYFDFHTGGQYTFPAMRLFASPSAANGAKVGINTDSIGVDAQMSIAAPAGMPGLYTSYGMRIMGHPDGNKRISNATGIYAFTASIPANNTYTTVAIGRYHGATVTMRVGDASSKRTIVINYDLTQPAYGVAHLNVIANNGQWNTGSADVQLTSSGSYDYAIQVRHNSYYNTSNNSGVYMNFNVC